MEAKVDLRYPIGKFEFAGTTSNKERQSLIDQIAATPEKMRAAVTGLDDEQLNKPYRPEGWTVRQVVHHVPESHMNSTIKTYFEDRWAQLDDAQQAPVDLSLNLLDTLHERWVWFLRSLKEEDFQRCFRHPELGAVSVDKNIALYAWHGRHHVAHITSLRERMGW